MSNYNISCIMYTISAQRKNNILIFKLAFICARKYLQIQLPVKYAHADDHLHNRLASIQCMSQFMLIWIFALYEWSLRLSSILDNKANSQCDIKRLWDLTIIKRRMHMTGDHTSFLVYTESMGYILWIYFCCFFP